MNILITGGMDYDEYAGIEAALALKKYYRTNDHITVLPLDYVPLDQKIPKLVFPGSITGTKTDQLMHWLYETHVKHTNLWIDLHGGSPTEELTPFVWMYQSKQADIQTIHGNFIRTTSAPIIVYDKHPFMKYSKFLDEKNIAYILMESGDQGTRRKKDIETLVTWVEEYLTGTKQHNPKIYTSVRYVFNASQRINAQLLWKNIDPFYKNGVLYAAYALP